MFEISDLRKREILYLRSVCPPREVGCGYFYFFSLIFFGFFRKLNIFVCMKILWIFFVGHHKIGLYSEVISMHFRVFSEGQGT